VAEKGIIAVKALAEDIRVPTQLRDLGVPREALEGMAVATMDIDRILVNNPKPLTLDDVRQIWHNAW
jgi:alcohol dehydrogenase class IV